MDAVQAIVDAALAVVRHRRGELPASGDAGDPLERLVAAVEAYEQLAGSRDAAAPLPSPSAQAQNSHETQEEMALVYGSRSSSPRLHSPRSSFVPLHRPHRVGAGGQSRHASVL
jgi:hypothetical protein